MISPNSLYPVQRILDMDVTGVAEQVTQASEVEVVAFAYVDRHGAVGGHVELFATDGLPLHAVGFDFSPAEARRVASLLLSAADQVESARVNVSRPEYLTEQQLSPEVTPMNADLRAAVALVVADVRDQYHDPDLSAKAAVQRCLDAYTLHDHVTAMGPEERVLQLAYLVFFDAEPGEIFAVLED